MESRNLEKPKRRVDMHGKANIGSSKALERLVHLKGRKWYIRGQWHRLCYQLTREATPLLRVVLLCDKF